MVKNSTHENEHQNVLQNVTCVIIQKTRMASSSSLYSLFIYLFTPILLSLPHNTKGTFERTDA